MFWNVLIFCGKLVVGIVAAFLFTILAVLMICHLAAAGDRKLRWVGSQLPQAPYGH